MRDFAFVDCYTLDDSIRIVEYSRSNGIRIKGQELQVSHSKIKKVIQA